jgi:hypothetical protein
MLGLRHSTPETTLDTLDGRTHRESGQLLALPHACFFFATVIGPGLLWVLARSTRAERLREQAAAALNFQLAWAASFLPFGAWSSFVGDDPSPGFALEQISGIVLVASIVMIVLGFQQSLAAIGEAGSGRVHRYVLRPPLFT